ncbi:MAG: VWA domain-containing protein [Candidatus Competibacteraceae bacterium]|nr:VWA domain-containing protein [Candidatus Competibacteraceae bacterium]
MPLLDTDSDKHALPNAHYGYSAVKIDKLGASEYTLAVIVNDVSSSVHDFKTEMEDALKEIIKACAKSPRADNLLVRLVQFANNVSETHGFKMLQDCNVDDYDDILHVGGSTALYDAAANAISSASDYAKKLNDQDFKVNAIIIVITDGDDNVSLKGVDSVREALQRANREESLESIVTILVGVNVQDQYMSNRLGEFKTKAGMTQYAELKNANANTLAKLADFVSKSISAQSQSLGSGGASKPLTL